MEWAVGAVVGFVLGFYATRNFMAEKAKPIFLTVLRERWRYLHTLRRELANRIMMEDPDRFVRMTERLYEERKAIYQLTREARDGQIAELAKTYPKIEDLALLRSRDYILYEDAFSGIKLDTVARHYHDIVTYQHLHLASEEMLRNLDWAEEVMDADWSIHAYVQEIKDKRSSSLDRKF